MLLGRITWQVEQAKLASHAPSSSTSNYLATSSMWRPAMLCTSRLLPSRRMKLNFMSSALMVNRPIFRTNIFSELSQYLYSLMSLNNQRQSSVQSELFLQRCPEIVEVGVKGVGGGSRH